MFYKLLVFLVLLVQGCATSTVPNPDSVYPDHPDPTLMASLPFIVGSVRYEGAALLPRATRTKINVEVPDRTVFLFFNTCGREDLYKNPKSGTFEYIYTPAFEKENMDSCMLLITAVTATGEYHRSAIDFTNSTGRDLAGDVFCNGKWIKSDGSYFCQTRGRPNVGGIPTGVRFASQVISAGPPQCPPLKCLSGCTEVNGVALGKEFEVNTGVGFCGYDFMDQSQLVFRLTTLGYTSVLNVFPPAELKR